MLNCETQYSLLYKILIVHIVSVHLSFSITFWLPLSLCFALVSYCTYPLIVAGRLLSLLAQYIHYLRCTLLYLNLFTRSLLLSSVLLLFGRLIFILHLRIYPFSEFSNLFQRSSSTISTALIL